VDDFARGWGRRWGEIPDPDAPDQSIHYHVYLCEQIAGPEEKKNIMGSSITIDNNRPGWLNKRFSAGEDGSNIEKLISSQHLHTVCQEAKCPNIWECFSKHTATFMIMGDRCTRNCRFCGVEYGPKGFPDPGEPERLAEVAFKMNLRYIVVTSVTRDDVPFGGAGFFAETIRAIRRKIPNSQVEVLIPDFQGDSRALEMVVSAKPDVLNHNIETVPRLYPEARPEADYHRSIELLVNVRFFDATMTTKSGLMLGLGETEYEVKHVLADLANAGCSILTLGQYLQPTKNHLPVRRYIEPEEYERWREMALDMGFAEVSAGPFVRSSYNAKEVFLSAVTG
jgi:lipoic acid synthetase